MKKTITLKAVIIIFFSLQILCLCGCYGSWNVFYEGNDVDYRTESIKDLSGDSEFLASGLSTLSGSYNVLVLTDTHYGYSLESAPEGKLISYLDKVKADDAANGTSNLPKFVICLGDAVDLGEQSEFNEFLAFYNRLKNDYGVTLLLNTVGNHDLYQGHWENWKKNCYPHTSFYKFKTSNFSWYAFDTGSGTIGRSQYNKLAAVLASDSRPKIVFTHYPLTQYKLAFGLGDTTERNLLIYQFAKNNVRCVFGGHNHKYGSENLGFNEYALPSFRFNKNWSILHVDEASGTAYITVEG